ncbi:Hypothetical predicted protein [Mytilus galloprovincialis]|uniref:WAP domain-containing protein n=1 Tax=Mytilus galloprovincialis TaxID=29158 RepID=A0A8B6CIB9_MYTGA|nr:Hypothetical predicted protein [Mytilus galloprovincialis]
MVSGLILFICLFIGTQQSHVSLICPAFPGPIDPDICSPETHPPNCQTDADCTGEHQKCCVKECHVLQCHTFSFEPGVGDVGPKGQMPPAPAPAPPRTFRKPGKCPAVNLAALTCRAGELPRKCYNDLSCPGIQKCCRRLCEFVCLNPAPVKKPGDCPFVNLALVDCFAGPLPRQCNNDDGCPGKQKCCRSRRGCSIVCRDPGNPCPPEPVCPSSPVRPDQCEPMCIFEYETLNGITCKIRCTRGPLDPRPRPGQLCPPTGCPLFGPQSKPSPTKQEPPAPSPPPPSVEKPGECPYVNLAAISCLANSFSTNCLNDGSCPGNQKCCHLGCLIDCTYPVTER